jgi:hypothetical protein
MAPRTPPPPRSDIPASHHVGPWMRRDWWGPS